MDALEIEEVEGLRFRLSARSVLYKLVQRIVGTLEWVAREAGRPRI